MIEIATRVMIYIIFATFMAKRSLTYMHVLQQEDYYNGRLLKWIWGNKAFDKRLTVSMFFLGFAALVPQYIPTFLIDFLIFILFAIATYTEIDPRKNSKKKLVSTARAKRIFFPAIIINLGLASWAFYFSNPWPWLFNIHFIPFSILLVNFVLQPIEDIIQQVYWNEAHEKLQRLKPTVIAITGSYGKTSVKHILGHILKTQGNTLITPGSVNTAMGISRIVREQLDESHKYFVVEMGAYGKGSIERLCQLAPPDYGIITAIGHAHFERFKSLETVALTKFELAESVLKKQGDGKVVIHERTLRFPHPRNVRSEHNKRMVICGDAPNVTGNVREVSYMQPDDLHIQKVIQMPEGLEIRLTWKGTTHIISAPLYGTHHGHNIALAFATALSMGIDAADVVTALGTLPQIEHRLEVRKNGDVTIIDDAYNSNPLGFRSALDLMAILSQTGRKILITPGIVELGIAHDEVHSKLGQYAGEVCDVAVIVNPNRIKSFVTGFKATGSAKTLVEVSTFDEANEWINKNKQANDVVLIENDLPDMYERIPKM